MAGALARHIEMQFVVRMRMTGIDHAIPALDRPPCGGRPPVSKWQCHRRLPAETHGTNNIDYVAGSGMSVRSVVRALREFLATCELPRNIRWVLESDLEAGTVHVLERGA